MRFVPERVDDQRLHLRDLFHNSGGNSTAIAEIRDQLLAITRKQVAVHHRVPVRDRQRGEQRFSQLKRAVHQMPHWLQITGETIEAIESEFENAFEIAHRFRRGVDGHRA